MTALPKTNLFKGIVFNLLSRTTGKRQELPYRIFWNRLFTRTRHWSNPISTVIHGKPVVVNFNYTYPICCRMFPMLNNPLVELVHQAFLSLGRPVRLVDVGAAIGDTVLLVDSNCPRMVSEYICVDGDAEFFAYLESNLSTISNCKRILHQLSSSHGDQNSLVRIHGGTASAQGTARVQTAPLAHVLEANKVGPVDVLKVDVDGFDGEVLSGADTLLREQQPLVIYEWHPKLCQQTGNDAFKSFQVLREAGYKRLVWFTKVGTFSHFGSTNDDVSRMHHYCMTSKADSDCHFDIIAIPDGHPIDEQVLADLTYARAKTSVA